MTLYVTDLGFFHPAAPDYHRGKHLRCVVLVRTLRNLNLRLLAKSEKQTILCKIQHLIVCVGVDTNPLCTDEIETKEGINFALHYIAFNQAR